MESKEKIKNIDKIKKAGSEVKRVSKEVKM